MQLIVQRGLTISEAAETAGMQGPSLQKAMKKPHVLARLSDLKRAWFTNQTGKAWLVVAKLAADAASPEVQLKAARTLLEKAGELGPHRRDDNPPAGQVIQILVTTGGTGAAMPDGSGVFELPPYAPPSRDGSDDEG
ncbi:hypothetical protein [Brevundimonas sp.]|uniref:hypothetical protein n=1 Tax=Brevundimonas sp. TaxID=1871086 RepID=UPI003BAC86AC